MDHGKDLLDVYGHFMPTDFRSGFADAIARGRDAQERTQAHPRVKVARRASEPRLLSRRIASENIGADGRIRTGDLLITNQLLYQLSYVSAQPG